MDLINVAVTEIPDVVSVTVSELGTKGDIGPAGPKVLFQYSVTGTTWHDSFQAGDIYFRSSNDNQSTWSDAVLFQGPPGPAGPGGMWGSINGTLSNQTDLQAALDAKQAALGFTPVPQTRQISGHALTYDLTLVKADVGLASVDNTADADKPVSTATQTALDAIDKSVENVMSTGLLSGGQIGINIDPTKWDLLTPVIGIVVNNYTDPANPVKQLVTISAQSGLSDPLIGSVDTTYVYTDSAGVLHYRGSDLTPAERRQYFAIGWLDHPDHATITATKEQPQAITDIGSQLQDFMLSFGPFNIDGNEYSALTGLQMQRSAGDTFDPNANYVNNPRSPHIVTTNLESPVGLQYYLQDGIGGWINDNALVSVVDPEHWDDGSGTLASVPAGKFTIQILSFYSQGLNNDIQYGQVVYDTLAAAQSALQTPVKIDPYNAYDTFRAWVIIQQGCTDLTNAAQCVIQSAGKLGLTSIQSGGGTGGEVNTASNVGLAGVGLYDAKIGVNLGFRNLEAGPLIGIALDTPNKCVKITTSAASKAYVASMSAAMSMGGF